ncbi:MULTISPECIES: HPr family phosphocarrier protein [Glycomyces]|uniref:Phosphocarrier protein n=2 Tax=Glycomyces TaxID=58113 RepID=A0A9X3SZD5_9ACTN|nr:HPr family phosphocarrier protein [Glycomyces lechevalierae]MDA1387256.1 HPr family phosphocarrier protein [Glycomyces lechevalierae]MDR7338480.1 phosphocarrier protein [Glycomyces lechevalierae]
MAERRVKVTTEVGIQARPATVFVGTAAESGKDVSIAKPGGDPHDAKSILQVLTLDVRPGDEIVLAGDDEAVLDRLVDLVSGDADTGGVDIGDIDEN